MRHMPHLASRAAAVVVRRTGTSAVRLAEVLGMDLPRQVGQRRADRDSPALCAGEQVATARQPAALPW